jgi:hypothetical protein
MESIITKEHLLITLENVKKVRKSGTDIEIIRAGAFLEGILYSLDKLHPKCNFPYKDIQYVEVGWFGKEKVKTREQTYVEYMIERVEELIKEIE